MKDQQETLEQIVTERLKYYVIDFESCMVALDDSSSCNSSGSNNYLKTTLLDDFRQFLKLEHNLAALDFLLKANELDSIKEPKQRYRVAKEIIDMFFRDTSQTQINLPNVTREVIMAKFHNYSSVETGVDPTLFDSARVDVHIQLKTDNFLRFVNNKLFVKHVANVVKQYINSMQDLDAIYRHLDGYLQEIGDRRTASSATSSTLSDQQTDVLSSDSSSESLGCFEEQSIFEKFSQTLLQDKTRRTITENDFDIVKSIITAPHDKSMWKCFSEQSNYSCFLSEKKFYAKSKKRGIKLYKETGVLEASPEEVLTSLTHSRFYTTVETQITSSQLMDFVTDKDTGLSVSYIKFAVKLPWPLTKREMILGCSIRKEKGIDNRETDYLFLRRGIDPQDVEVIKGCTRAIYMGGVLIERLSDIHTRYTCVCFVDMQGKVPAQVWNHLSTLRGSQFFGGLKKAIQITRELHEQKTIDVHDFTSQQASVDSNRISETLRSGCTVKRR